MTYFVIYNNCEQHSGGVSRIPTQCGVVGIIIYPRMINAGSLSNVEQSVISCRPPHCDKSYRY